MTASRPAPMKNPTVQMLSRVTVGGKEGYVCARTWACTSHPELYDVRLTDTAEAGKIIPHLLVEQLQDVREPDGAMLERVVR